MRDRFFLWLIIFIIAGIVISLYLPFHFYWAIGIAVLSLLILAFNRPVAVCTLVMATVMLISANFYFSKSQYYKDIQIEGTVQDVCLEDHGDIAVIIDDCTHKEIGKTKVRVYIDISDKHPIKQGNKIKFYGNASPDEFRKGNINDHALQNVSGGIKYTFYASEYEIVEDKVNFGYHLAVFKEKVRNIIFENVDNSDSASVLYAMVSGDKNYIPENITEHFKACGTSHLLAVSGLHVSIFLSLFILLLKKLNIKVKASLLIIGVLVFVYSAFTGFSSSVIRASIMALAVNLSVITGEKYDSVNSLGFAGSCILMIEPYRLFDISFQLSFLACFGIAWIIGYRKKFKLKILGAIVDAGLISVGATIFTLPVQIYYFGTLSTISVIANVLIVSVASITLVLVFTFVAATLIWNSFGIFLNIPGYIMGAIIKITEFLSGMQQIVFRPASTLATVAIIVLMIFFSRFFRFKYKRIVAGILIFILPFMWINTAIYHNNYVMICGGNGYVHIRDNKNYVLGLAEKQNLEKQLNYINNNIGKVNVLVLLDYEDVCLLQTAIEYGLQFDELYAAKFVRPDNVVEKNNMEIVASLKTSQGEFDFSQDPLFFCGDQCIDINNLIKEKSYEETYIRSH